MPDLKFDWPFPTDEIAMLQWVHSPRMVGTAKQWYMPVSFQGESGQAVVLDFPWGALPELRFGTSYRNGKLIGGFGLGKTETIFFTDSLDVQIQDASSLLPQAHYHQPDKAARERCVVIVDGYQVTVIPCIEVIRAFYCINRFLTSAILRPDSFNGICSSNLENRVASLHFSKNLPSKLLNRIVAEKIALILFDQPFEEKWKKVFNDYTLEKITNDMPPFQCVPPILANSCWDVRGVRLKDFFLVLEILKAEEQRMLPFSKVEFHHPSFIKREKAARKPRESSNEEAPAASSEEITVSRSPVVAPKELSSPLTTRVRITSISYGVKMPIEKVQRQGTRREGSSAEITNGKRRRRIQYIEGTYNEEAGLGDVKSLDFIPIENAERIPAGMKAFFDAVSAMKLDGVLYFINQVPFQSALADAEGVRRSYGLISVPLNGKQVYMLEIDKFDGHQISTLIFTPLHQGVNIFRLVYSLLTECVISGGHWDRENLGNYVSINFLLEPHSNYTTEKWGNRLLLKANMLSPIEDGLP